MTSLSIILIAKNESANIDACLESVAWADEIIVVDSGSTDDTIARCLDHGAKVYAHDWQGFGIQKNRALSYATQDWVFSIDADERVTPELRDAIVAAMAQPDFSAYRLSRLSNYCGRFMRHSGWYPDHILRLFKRGEARFNDALVHETIVFNGEAGMLSGELLHYSYDNFEQVLNKNNAYSTAAAQMKYQQGKSASLTGAVLRGLWAFFRTYCLRMGFLDGRQGFMVSVSNAEETYYRYLKLMLLNEKARR
ncbi:MAG: glycosyltransferase family 2 protein [Gallionella sp.]|nr:glycosyltransferase family 2 protein [Gallionella sp.]MDD4957812.1 glycosyltransferase family 2 protein [Gallionella sp.]